MNQEKIEFKRLSIPNQYGQQIHKIYYLVKNGRSKVIENFKSLSENDQDNIKDLICRMATKPDFKSPKIKYNLKGYDFGEIRPMPHRFFFFRKCGNNYIFFNYAIKKKGSLDNRFYKGLDKEKRRYEKEFEKFIQRN